MITTEKISLAIIILSSLFLIISLIYFFAIKKEQDNDEIIASIVLIVFGILGSIGIWYGLKSGRTSRYTFYATFLYMLTPIIWGSYILLKHWKI